MPAAFAQKPLLLPNPIPFPHHSDTYPTPTPTPSLQPRPQLPSSPSFRESLLDTISTFPNPLLLLLIAVLGTLVLYKAVVFVRSYARARLARRELRRALVERMEKSRVYEEGDDDDED